MVEEIKLLKSLDLDVCELVNILIEHYEGKNDCSETTEDERLLIKKKLKVLYYGCQ
ncbi:hypothetical protein [Sutcliffiella horikoshii]|uniref:hypothetical protein n=1 Tax=Sutcliffiella horikoshii TaxID=79883 RepID=UPI001653C56E|nr:hypothetical protein [Sutcliffiella horikoshii]